MFKGEVWSGYKEVVWREMNRLEGDVGVIVLRLYIPCEKFLL